MYVLLQVPTILLLMCCVLLFGYMQPFKRNLVNILEFVFLVDFLLLQMIKSTDDIQVYISLWIYFAFCAIYCCAVTMLVATYPYCMYLCWVVFALGVSYDLLVMYEANISGVIASCSHTYMHALNEYTRALTKMNWLK